MEPIFLSQIEIDRPAYIRFHLPPQETDGYDVEITVDFGYKPNDKKMIVANAWARIGDSSIKGYISSVYVPYDEKTQPEIVEYDEKIISALNLDETFLDRLEKYIEMCAGQK